MNLTPPKSAYVHIPFCRHHCGYCNFTVIADRLDLEKQYLDALEIELGWLQSPQPVETLYIGGGTPTELTDEGLTRLCKLMDTWFPRVANSRSEQSDQTDRNADALSTTFEYTFEANPEGLTQARLDQLAQNGVNRISLGVQSFNNAKLQTLDRQHSAEQADQAITWARERIPNISIDLIFASPDESLETWLADLNAAIQHQTTHVSTYGLTVEPGTLFFNRRQKGDLHEVIDDLQREMYIAGIETLTSAGFEHYEVSSFARPERRSRHNQVYWQGLPFFAVGAGASRYVDGQRETNHRSTTAYIKSVLSGESPVAESERLNDEERARERLVFGLRRIQGVDAGEFETATGFSLQSLTGDSLPLWIDEGWMEWKGPMLRLTRRGLLVSDSLWPEIL